MKKIEKNKSKIEEETIQSNIEKGETDLMKEQDVTTKIPVKFYLEATRPYFSSPCMLSEIEDQYEFFTIT